MQQEGTKKTRRIQQVSVKNLFGIFSHVIPLKMDDRITIIHGPNGFGKTMMLKLLHALFSQSNQLLQDIPFDEFRVDFEDGGSFWISKTTSASEIEEEQIHEQRIIFHATGKEPYLLQRIKSSQLSFTLWEQTKDVVALQNLQGLFIENSDEPIYDQLSTELINEQTKMPEWLTEMRKSVPIRLIETQRLLNSALSPTKSLARRRSEPESKYAVTEDSRHIVEVIKRKLAESARLSQSLDRTFPARVISPTTQQLQVSEQELLDKLEQLEEKRSRLMETGLLDQETGTAFPVGPNQRIGPDTKAVLAVYAEDTEKKLGIFDELAQKIDLLTTIIDNRFLYKTMTINKELGLIFTSKNGTILPLENLSSGEQHELVLFYELLFRVTPGSLILIDEPELSLHVVWQEQFLKDVQQVAQLIDIDIILATHSPDIINDRRDLVVELEEPKNGRL